MEKFNETLFLNLTARQALLGRHVPFLSKVKKMIATFGLDINLPEVLDGDIFGYLALQNNTNSGPFEIYTGYQASMPALGDLISYKGKRRGTEFQGKCNRIQTSIGELRPMPIMSDQILEIWQPQLCRILRLQPNKEKLMREGMAIAYSFAEKDFMSGLDNPDNSCYCINRTTTMSQANNNNNNLIDNYCSLNGALELAPCSYYSPILLTVNNIEPDQRITDSIGNWEPEMRDSQVELLKGPDKMSQFLILKRIGVPISGDITLTLFMKVVRDPSFK